MGKLIMIAALLAAATLSGCATKTFGRMGSLTPFERETMTCREIALEAARTDGFIERVTTESRFDHKDVLAFLGDFGIGNSMERQAAMESATLRRGQLGELATAKQCGAIAALPAVSSPLTSPASTALPAPRAPVTRVGNPYSPACSHGAAPC